MSTTAELLPVGTRVSITLHSIGYRTERVTGTVTGPDRRGRLHTVRTDSGHGDVVARREELTVLAEVTP